MDGHDVAAIDGAMREAVNTSGRPIVIIARTEKGHGVSFLADEEGWHGKPVPSDREQAAIDFDRVQRAILDVEKQVQGLEEIRKSAQSIRSCADKIEELRKKGIV